VSRKKSVFQLGVVAIALAAVVSAVTAQDQGLDTPIQVAVVEVGTSEFVNKIEALGTTRANETANITSGVTEKVVEIRFDDGQRVTAGDVLVVLDSSEEQADLEAARAVLEERQLAYERAKQLERRKFTATAQLDERRAALRQAEAEIGAIQARLDDRTIRAPFDAIVGLRDISVGALVEPGDLITTLDDISVIKLDFNVPATHLATLSPGLSIAVRTSAFGDRPFNGTVSGVDSRVDPVTRSIVARALIPNPDGALRPGLLMTVQLLKNPRTSLVVPEEALVPRGRINTVYVVDEEGGGIVDARQVEIGVRRSGEVEILGGLEVGDKVITHGTARVRPGQRVIIENWGGDKPLAGKVLRIEPLGKTTVSALGIEEQRVDVVIDFTGPRARWEKLGHGFRVETRIVLWEAENALKVPLSAVFRFGDRWAVFVASGNRAQRRIVQIGRRTSLEAAVVGGLEAGERVVVHPSDRITDGVRVAQRP